jgi:hypothetical protein
MTLNTYTTQTQLLTSSQRQFTDCFVQRLPQILLHSIQIHTRRIALNENLFMHLLARILQLGQHGAFNRLRGSYGGINLCVLLRLLQKHILETRIGEVDVGFEQADAVLDVSDVILEFGGGWDGLQHFTEHLQEGLVVLGIHHWWLLLTGVFD